MASADQLIDRLAIRDLLENWVVWHDAADWERFSTVWHEGGRMRLQVAWPDGAPNARTVASGPADSPNHFLA